VEGEQVEIYLCFEIIILLIFSRFNLRICFKDIKHEVRRKNLEQKIDEVKVVAENELRNYGADKVKPHWDHINK